MNIRLVLGAAIALSQVACASVPPTQAQDFQLGTRPHHSWNDPELHAALQSLGGESRPASDELSATESFAAALAFSPQIALLRAQVDVGHAGVLVARQRVNPVLSLTPERVLNAALGASPWVAAISLVWPVQTAGKRSLAIEQALAASDASLLKAANEIWTLRTSVRAALCAAELATARLELAREEFALRDDLAGRLSKQADVGVASNYEAVRARLERDRTMQSVRRSEADVITAKHALAATTGLPFAEVDRRTLGESCLNARLTGTDQVVSDAADGAVKARLDLLVKMAEFRVADAAWRREVAKRWPDLNLGPGYTYDQGDRKITFTISGEIPIYARNDAAIASANAERNRAIAEIELLQFAVLEAVQRARDRIRAAEGIYSQAAQMVSRSQEVLSRDIERRRAGELDEPAVVASRLAVVLARSDMLLAQQEVSDALASLEAATQVPVVPPLFDGNAARSLLASQGASTEVSPQ